MLTVSDNHIVLGGGGGGGDVVGAASSTDNAIACFDGTTGKVLQNSNVIIDDSGSLYVNNVTGGQFPVYGIATFNATNSLVARCYFTGTGITNNNIGFAFKSGGVETYSFVNYQFGTGFNDFGIFNSQTSSWTLAIDGNTNNLGLGLTSPTAKLDVNGTFRSRDSATFNGQIIDNTGSSGTDGQVLKKVGGLVIWANP